MNTAIEACRNCLAAQPPEKRSCGLEDRAKQIDIQLGRGTMSPGRAAAEFGQMMGWSGANECPVIEEHRIGRPVYEKIHPNRPFPFTRPDLTSTRHAPYADGNDSRTRKPHR
jgi:hypothetical protein